MLAVTRQLWSKSLPARLGQGGQASLDSKKSAKTPKFAAAITVSLDPSRGTAAELQVSVKKTCIRSITNQSALLETQEAMLNGFPRET